MRKMLINKRRIAGSILIYLLTVCPAVLLSFLSLLCLFYLPMIKNVPYEDASSPALGIVILSYLQPSIGIGVLGAIPLSLVIEKVLDRFIHQVRNEH